MTKPTILIVDDEAIILMALKKELKNNFGAEFNYETALSADEAYGIIDELESAGSTILLIISDWLMPGTRGDEFLISVRERHPGIKSIMLTGHADRGSIEQAMLHAGLFACISKPWRSGELVAVVKRCLESASPS